MSITVMSCFSGAHEIAHELKYGYKFSYLPLVTQNYVIFTNIKNIIIIINFKIEDLKKYSELRFQKYSHNRRQSYSHGRGCNHYYSTFLLCLLDIQYLHSYPFLQPQKTISEPQACMPPIYYLLYRVYSSYVSFLIRDTC